MAKTIKLTDAQISVLLWAVIVTEASYDGWSDEDLTYYEVKRDLATLQRAYQKLAEVRDSIYPTKENGLVWQN
jgi:hypothetical protein